MPRQRKARSRVKKREKNATVDFTVHSRRMKVKTNQPWVRRHCQHPSLHFFFFWLLELMQKRSRGVSEEALTNR